MSDRQSESPRTTPPPDASPNVPSDTPTLGETLLYDTRGPVWREADGETVRKEYDHGDQDVSRHQARQEFDRLTRFERALESIPNVRCPHPLSLNERTTDQLPSIRMEWCSGEELFFFLSRPEVTAETRRSIADRMAAAIITYVETFDEPYLDCSFHNALYDAESDMLTLFDFGPRRQSAPPRSPIGPLESSLGSVLSMAVRSQLGPSRNPPWRKRIAVIRTAARVVSRAEEQSASHSLNQREFRGRAWRTYGRYTHTGPIPRQIWYRSGGALLASIMFRGYRRIAL